MSNPQTLADNPDKWKRLSSIVRSLTILFDNPIIGMEMQVSGDYEDLLDSQKPLSLLRINRLLSLLNSYKELFGNGNSSSEKAAAMEVQELGNWLKSIRLEQEQIALKARFNPKNLGLSFIKKNYGAPLFGMHRPVSIPQGNGLLLCYQAKEAGNAARLYGCRKDNTNMISYTEMGTKLTSKSRWSSCNIFNLPIEEALDMSTSDCLISDRFLLSIAHQKTSAKSLSFPPAWEPYDFRYLYYFYDDASIFIKLRQFVTGLLSGLFGFPAREAENMATLFAQRSL